MSIGTQRHNPGCANCRFLEVQETCHYVWRGNVEYSKTYFCSHTAYMGNIFDPLMGEIKKDVSIKDVNGKGQCRLYQEKTNEDC